MFTLHFLLSTTFLFAYDNLIDTALKAGKIQNIVSNVGVVSRNCGYIQNTKNLNQYLDRTPGLNSGKGVSFNCLKYKSYLKLKQDSYNKNKDIQWSFKELETDNTIDESSDSEKLYYGASVSKIVVAASFLNNDTLGLSIKEKQHIRKLIKKSNNRSWAWLQDPSLEIENCLKIKSSKYCVNKKGVKKVLSFQTQIGITKSRMWRGYGGNYISSKDMNRFLSQTFKGNYKGANYLLKELFYIHTGKSKGDKYLAKDIKIGGKTGTWGGRYHHSMIIRIKNKFYALSILSKESNEDIALLAGGLVREHLNYYKRFTCP